MKKLLLGGFAVAAFGLAASGADFLPRTQDSVGFLSAVSGAVDRLEAEIPSVVATAEQAAARIWRNPYAGIEVPREGQWGFAEELLSRAGGLAQIESPGFDSPDNVVLLSSRLSPPADAAGKLVVRCPAVTADRRVNAIADVVYGWMWCCEYGSAMTRLCGRFPAVLRGLLRADSWIVNCAGWAPFKQPRLLPCPEKVPPERLAREYLAVVKDLLRRMDGPETRAAIAQAAEVVRARLDSGHAVGVAGLGHLIIEECALELRSPMKGICAAWTIPQAFSEALKPGDLMIWIASCGLNSFWRDYGSLLNGAGLDVVASYSDWMPAPTNGYVKAFIPQHWSREDAEVAIPVPPYRMAPVSEVCRCTILRMLDEEVVRTHPRSRADEPAPYQLESLAGVNNPPAMRPAPSGPFEWTEKGLTFIQAPDRRWSLKGKTSAKYDLLRPLSNRLIAYEIGGRFGLMDVEGRELTPPNRELIAPFGLFGMKERDYAVYAEKGKYGKMDPRTGEPLTPAVYTDYPQ